MYKHDLWRCELHCHSTYSRDSHVSIDRLIDICRRKKLDAIALTDHNEIAGALELSKKAPNWLTVIVGEEISTVEGDLIGLFLKKKIEPRQSIVETITQIHQQGGLALLPHPFDRLRYEAVGQKTVDKVKDKIDFIEVFNSRCLFAADNRLARSYAHRYSLKPYVGSDAHLAREYGRAVAQIKPFKDANSFKESLKKAVFITRQSSPLVHVQTKLTKHSQV